MTNCYLCLIEAETIEDAPLLAVGKLIEGMITELLQRAAERLESKDQWGAKKQLGRAVRSVEAERCQLRQHLDRGDNDEAIQSVKRLLKKVVRLHRRIEVN